MFKKVLLLSVVVLFVLSIGFAKPVTIQFMTFSASGDSVKYFEEMKEVFETKNPDIKVDVQSVGFEDYFTKLMTVIAGKNAPDTFELNYENFYTYAKKGILLDLEQQIESSGFEKSNINEMALKAFKLEGEQYGLPFSFSNVVLFYNKDLFDKAGVAYPTKDWDWEDEQNAAEKISALGPMTFGIFQPIQFWEFYKIVKQNGGNLFNEDRTEFTLDTKENIETLQFMVDRVLESNVMPNDAQLAGMGDWDLFLSGRLGMLVTGTWAFPTFISDCDFDWDIAVEPGNTQKATHFFSNGLVVSKNTEHPEEAFKWIEFLSASREVAKIRIDSGWELPAVTYEDILSDYVSQTPPENRKAVFDSLDYLVTPPVINQFAEMADIVTRYLEKAKYGELSPKEALTEAQRELSKKIELE